MKSANAEYDCLIDGTMRRGEKLSYKDMAAAMAAMDTTGNGTIQLQEFEQWWLAHVGSSQTGELAKTNAYSSIRMLTAPGCAAICVPLQVVSWRSGDRAR
eukprot:COSAG02_NODE_1320_length_13269_cov_11.420058_14_plen_100_part_00